MNNSKREFCNGATKQRSKNGLLIINTAGLIKLMFSMLAPVLHITGGGGGGGSWRLLSADSNLGSPRVRLSSRGLICRTAVGNSNSAGHIVSGLLFKL